jgi:hypothetical protein
VTDKIKVEGLTTLRATLKIAARKIGDMSSPAGETAAFLATRGRADAPRRTGRLASSVRGTGAANHPGVSSPHPYANPTQLG